VVNETDLRKAIVAIAEADTGAGGVATLIAKTHPVVRWGDRAMRDRPIVTVYFGTTTYRSPRRDPLTVPATFSAFVEAGANGLEDEVLDRLVAVLTAPAFKAQGLDVAPFPRRRRDMAALEEGGQRKDLDMDFWLNR
jgi:hypothetical protein